MRYFPMIRSLKAALFLTLLAVMPLFLWTESRLDAVCAILIALISVPVLIPVSALWGGFLPMAVCCLSAILLAYLPFGTAAALRMAIYLVPYTAVFLVVTGRQKPFFRAVLMMIAALFIGGFFALLQFRQALGPDYCRELATQFTGLIRDSNRGAEVLLVMRQYGLAAGTANPVYMMTPQGLSLTITPRELDELLLSLTNLLTDLLVSLPASLMRYAIWCPVIGEGFGMYIGRRSVIRNAVWSKRRKEITEEFEQRHRAEQADPENRKTIVEDHRSFVSRMQETCEEALKGFPDLKMPNFALWHLPRGTGLMAALPALGYLFAFVTDSERAAVIGNMFGQVFVCLYTIQGMAAFNFMLLRRNVQPAFRMLILGTVCLLFSRAFLIVGIMDQLSNFRALRPPLGGDQQ